MGGKPKVEWEPKTNRWSGEEIQAVLKGAIALAARPGRPCHIGSPGRFAPPDEAARRRFP